MDSLSSTTSKEIGEAIINRLHTLSSENLRKHDWVVDPTADTEMSEPGASNDDMLFTPSSKCPKAFVKERVVFSPDDPSWVIRKMNSDFAKAKKDNVSILENNFQYEEETDSLATTALDTVSLSTDLAPYMASTSLSQHDSDETSLSSNSQMGDITVISVTDEEDNSTNPQILKSVLKDSSNAPNSNENHGKFGLNRSKSFTLECPSPLLIDALQENRIGLEPSPEKKTLEMTNMGSIPRKPRMRIPVSRSLMFSVAEKKETIDGITFNQTESDSCSPTEKIIPKLKNHSVITEDELKMPALSIKKLCNETGKFFKPVSLCTSYQDSKYLSQFHQTTGSLATHFDNISLTSTCHRNTNVMKNFCLNERSYKEEELSKNENIDPVSCNALKHSEDNVSKFLKEKQESFKQFLDDFSHKELTRTFTVPPKCDQVLEAQNTQHREEINNIQEEISKIRDEMKTHCLCLEETKLLKQKIEVQETLILELKNQLRAQEKKQTEWMEYIFDIQTVKLERMLQQQMEVFIRQFQKDTISDVEFEGFDGPVESIQNISLPKDYNSSDSSTNSVKTVIKAKRSPSENSVTMERFFMSSQAKTSPNDIITPTRALDPKMKPKFDKISAIVKGFLTRQLMKTHKVQAIIKTIKDTMSTALQIHTDLDVDPPKSRAILSQDVQLSKRLINQLNAACHEFSSIFFDYSIKEQMSLIAQSRELRENPRPKAEFRKMAKRHPRTKSLTPQVRNNSTYTKHQRRKTEFSPTNSYSGRMKRTSSSVSPRLFNRRVCRSSAANLTHETKDITVLTSFVTETPKKELKMLTFNNRSPSFFN